MTPEQITAARALVDAATPGNKWRAAGLPDPHGTRYDCPRSELPMSDLSDDELANGVYLYGDSQPPIADLISGKAKTSGVWLDAAKNRIRWLSRRLDALNDMTARAEAAEARAADLTAKLEAARAILQDLVTRADTASPTAKGPQYQRLNLRGVIRKARAFLKAGGAA